MESDQLTASWAQLRGAVPNYSHPLPHRHFPYSLGNKKNVKLWVEQNEEVKGAEERSTVKQEEQKANCVNKIEHVGAVL